MNARNRFVIAAAIAALTAAPASAQSVSAADPESVAGALRDLGWRASHGVDAEGDPMIQSSIEGVDYTIYFYGCEGGRNCRNLLFSAGFDLVDGTTLQAMNEWNSGRLVGAAYLDPENDPFLQMFVTTAGGLNHENFGDVVDWWRIGVRDFKQHIGF
jgi:hypothetical protein